MRTLTDTRKKIAPGATQPGAMPPGFTPGGAGFTVRLAGQGALRALGLPGTAPAGTDPVGTDPAGGVREGRVLAVFKRSFYLAFGDENGEWLACFGPESIGAGPLNVICDLPEGIDWAASGLRPGDPARANPTRANPARNYSEQTCPGRTQPGPMSGLCVIAGRFSFYFEGVDIWRPCDLPGGIKQADVRKGLDLLAAMAGERAPAEGLGRLIPEMAGAARGVEGVVDVGVERGAAKSENVGDMSGPEAPEGACQTANAAKRQVIRAGRAGAGALARWMCDMLHPKPQGPTQPGLRIEISSPGQRAAGLIGLGPGLTPSGDDFIGGAMVALRMLGRGVIADRLAEWALPLAAGTSRISRAHLAEAARGAGAGALHEMIEAVSRSVEGDISSSLGAINAIGHTSGWDALAGAVMALEAVFRNELGRDGFATNFHIGDNL